MDLAEIWDRLVSVLYPQRCVLCGDVVEYDDMWCGKCALNRLGRVDCEIPHSFADAIAAVEYSGEARKAVWRIKDSADKRCLKFFAEKMRESMLEHWGGISFDLIVPVPSSKSRLESRGFNQAELLALNISGYLGVPICANALTRRDDSQVQRDLTKAERQVNAARSYGVGQAEQIDGKVILLVDDVFTTGATLAACSDKLLSAGAKSVYALTATKTHYKKPADQENPDPAGLIANG